MRWGCCTTVDHLPLLESVGYDYVEVSMVSLENEQEYNQVKNLVDRSSLLVEAFNVLLPSEIKVVGPEVNWDQISRYVKSVLPRAAALGGRVVVFGSGRSRRVPGGFPEGKARQQIVDFVRFLAELSATHDLVIGIEPLRQAECNLINYLSEAYQVAEALDLGNVGITADYYHMIEGGEPLENIGATADKLSHVHLADSGRMWPGSGGYDYLAFFRNLKAAGYDQRMSLECGWDDFPKNVETALAFLQDTWQKA
ncbi:MAG: sugar phosphate isomerase/epimerase [Firmicutes bacterium]|nr:sugar phosphate isomerase/epimerase [Bacillota bacterium]